MCTPFSAFPFNSYFKSACAWGMNGLSIVGFEQLVIWMNVWFYLHGLDVMLIHQVSLCSCVQFKSDCPWVLFHSVDTWLIHLSKHGFLLCHHAHEECITESSFLHCLYTFTLTLFTLLCFVKWFCPLHFHMPGTVLVNVWCHSFCSPPRQDYMCSSSTLLPPVSLCNITLAHK